MPLWWCKAIYHCSIIMFHQKLTSERQKSDSTSLSLQFNKPHRPPHLQFPLISCCHYVMCDGNFFVMLFSSPFLCVLASCQKWNLISHNDNVVIIQQQLAMMMWISKVIFPLWLLVLTRIKEKKNNNNDRWTYLKQAHRANPRKTTGTAKEINSCKIYERCLP